MSLKIVHAVFIWLSALLVAGLAVWLTSHTRGAAALWGSAAALAGLAALVAYGTAFVRRCRREGWSS